MRMERMLTYLAALEENNNKEWFHDNKGWYGEAKETFEALVMALMTAVQSFDENFPYTPAKELTFKLMRDTRFSHDKRPYNAAFRAHIGRAGKQPIPCDYYVSIRPGDASFLGGGLFAPMFPEATRRIRDAIAADGKTFGHIITQLNLPIQGEKLKRVPKEYDPALPQAEYLKHKSWYVEALIPDALLLNEPQFIQEAAWAFESMKPLNDFLNTAIGDYTIPKR